MKIKNRLIMSILSVVLCLSIIGTMPLTAFSIDESAGHLLGDINSDGRVNSEDARLALRIAARLDSVEEGSIKYRAADVDLNENINAEDARLILRVAAKLDEFRYKYIFNTHFVVDNAGKLTPDEIKQLNKTALEASDGCGIDICALLINGTGGVNIDTYIAEYLESAGYSENCIILVLDFEDNFLHIRRYGSADERLPYYVEDDIIDAFREAETYFDAFMAYIATVVSNLPNGEYKPLLVDEAGLLSAQEKQLLRYKLEEISRRKGYDVAVVTVNSHGSKSITSYTDDFYDHRGYGQGDDHSGIMLLVSMSEGEWHITTTGEAIQIFYDGRLKYMADRFVPRLSSGDFYGAFVEFADLCG